MNMTKHIISSLLLFFGAMIPASAINIACEPGQLSAKIKGDTLATTLTLTGTADATDLNFIARSMPKLENLDMSGLTIVSSEGILLGSVTRHPDNSLPSSVFAGTPMKTVTLPTTKGLNIGSGAFAGARLTSINIPSSVASVGDGAFAGCPDLATVTCGAGSLGTGVFSRCVSLKTIDFTQSTALPADSFYGCTALETVKGDITSVGERAFNGCTALTTFPFSANLTSIGKEAFMQSGLTSVNLSGCTKLTSVGEWAFAQMPRLTNIKMGPVATMNEGIAFNNTKLRTFETSTSATEIPDFAFSKSNVTDSTGLIPENVKYIGRYAMSGMTGITGIVLPTTLEKLDDHAMENMTGLKAMIAMIDNIPELGEDVWAGVPQGDVELMVPNDMINDYKAADQWKEFNVVKQLSSTDAISNEVLPELRARFEGDDLTVVSDGLEISVLMLYNPAGVLLTALNPDSDTVRVNTAGFDTRFFIVYASLADGRQAALKIAKR